jgi:hypothetical protein
VALVLKTEEHAASSPICGVTKNSNGGSVSEAQSELRLLKFMMPVRGFLRTN